MIQKSNHDFKEKYHDVRAGTIEPMHIKNILTKNRFLPYASVLEYKYGTKWGKSKNDQGYWYK